MHVNPQKDPPGEQDYFARLGVPRRYDLDMDLLKRNYLTLVRQTHPDFFAGRPEELPEALAAAAAINAAYRTLTDRAARAEYLLLLHGGKPAADDKRVPPEMLTEVLTIREELEAAKARGDRDKLKTLRRQMERQEAEVLEVIGELARRLAHGGDAAAQDDPATLEALRVQLNAMKYVRNIMDQL